MANKTAIILALALVVSSPMMSPALGSNKVKYVGGTLVSLPDNTEGTVDLSNPTKLVIVFGRNIGGPLKGTVSIEYTKVRKFRYGQDSRVEGGSYTAPNKNGGSGFGYTETKISHFLTIFFADQDGHEQTAVLELGSSISRTTIAILELRTGKMAGQEGPSQGAAQTQK